MSRPKQFAITVCRLTGRFALPTADCTNVVCFELVVRTFFSIFADQSRYFIQQQSFNLSPKSAASSPPNGYEGEIITDPNSSEGQFQTGGRFFIYFFPRSSNAAAVIAVTPVLIVGSGIG